MFITFEGVEGSGKSTQLRRLVKQLEQQNIPHLLTYEPGGTPVGDAIRQVLLSPESSMTAGTELFLMMASRRQITESVIIPALEQGKIVLCDRYVDASYAYQGYGRELGTQFVEDLANWACCGIRPDHTLLFDLPADVGLARAVGTKKKEAEAGQGDRIEQCGSSFLEKVRQGYLELARKQPDRFEIISVTGTEEETYNEMISRVRPWFEQWK